MKTDNCNLREGIIVRLVLRIGIMIIMLLGMFVATSIQHTQPPYQIGIEEWVSYTAVTVSVSDCCATTTDTIIASSSSTKTDIETLIIRWVQIVALIVLTMPVFYTVMKGQPEDEHPARQRPSLN